MQKKTLESPQMLRINIKHNFLSPFCHLIYWEDSFSFLAYMQLVLYQEWHTTEWCFPLCAVAASAFLVLQNRDCVFAVTSIAFFLLSAHIINYFEIHNGHWCTSTLLAWHRNGFFSHLRRLVISDSTQFGNFVYFSSVLGFFPLKKVKEISSWFNICSFRSLVMEQNACLMLFP